MHQIGLYKILEISPDASKDQIKKAYYKLAKIYHPDVNHHPGAREKFLKIQFAFDVLYHNKPVKRIKKKPKANKTYSSYARMREEMKREAYRKKYGSAKANNQYSNSKYGPATAFRKTFFKDEYSEFGRRMCYIFLYLIVAFGAFLVLLPVFVAFFYTEKLISTSTVISLIFGWFVLRFAYDWYNDLMVDFNKK